MNTKMLTKLRAECEQRAEAFREEGQDPRQADWARGASFAFKVAAEVLDRHVAEQLGFAR